MSGVELQAKDAKTIAGIKRGLSSLRILPVLATLAAVGVAAVAGWQAWQYYMGSPWTRDAAVRAYVVRIAPQVAGEIVQLPIADNQFVHKGDLLMLIDPTNYAIAVRQAEAAVEQARAVADNARAEMVRREKLSDIAVTMEERQTYISQATTAEATYQSALANLQQARVNYRRAHIRSPVNGYITDLSAQLGDYATVGQRQISVVNSDSFWVDAYFEETALSRIREGDAATIKLMGYSPLLRGRVQGLARGIDVPNAAPDASGLASVNPIFTFVRLAQRVPVRIHIDEVPDGVKLVAGLTATVQIEPDKAPPPAPNTKPAPAELSLAPPEAAWPQIAARPAPQAASQQTPGQALPPAASPPAASQAAVQAAQSQAAAGAAPQTPQQQNVAQSSAPASAANQLPVSTAPSAQASAAAAAASADLKTLEEQIAANPPTGSASPPTAANRRSNASADMMPPSEYLGQTIDLFAGPSVNPEPRRRAPHSIRRRARSRWRHYGQ